MVGFFCFFFQAEDGIRDLTVTGVQTCALPISRRAGPHRRSRGDRDQGPRSARVGRPSGVQAGRRARLLGVRRDAPGGRARVEAAVHDHAQPGAHVPHRPPELRARGAVSVRFLPAGDLAVLVEFDEEISVEVNTRVRALEFLIQQKGLTGVVETVPTFRSLLVYYDPRAVGYDAVCASITELLPQAGAAVLPPPRLVELPCCYEDPALGFELQAAATRLGISTAELVKLHSGAEYLVYFIGF